MAAVPHRVINIGSSQFPELLIFLLMDKALGREVIKNIQPMQLKHVVATVADTKLFDDWISFRPTAKIEVGVK